MPSEALLADLAKVIPADRIVTDPAGLFVYDADGLTIARSRPSAVVFPRTTEEVAGVVKLLARLDVQIIPSSPAAPRTTSRPTPPANAPAPSAATPPPTPAASTSSKTSSPPTTSSAWKWSSPTAPS
jgi:hypothetical protein